MAKTEAIKARVDTSGLEDISTPATAPRHR